MNKIDHLEGFYNYIFHAVILSCINCMMVTISVNLLSSKSLTASSASLNPFSQISIAYGIELFIS